AAGSGWLAARRDQQIGRALALLHDKPHQPWTVTGLADRVALSRSAFAARFTKLVGEPPLRYLMRLRLNAATARLRSGNDKLSVIAAAAGYDSAPAFAKAFKRRLGGAPGGYRRSRKEGDSAERRAAGKAKPQFRQRKLSRVSDDQRTKPAFLTIAIVVYCGHTVVLLRQGYEPGRSSDCAQSLYNDGRERESASLV